MRFLLGVNPPGVELRKGTQAFSGVTVVDVLSAAHVADALSRELALPPRTETVTVDREADDDGLRDGLRPVEHALGSRCEANWLELVLVFGDTLTLAGFPPWLTHLCEILHAVRCLSVALAGIVRRAVGAHADESTAQALVVAHIDCIPIVPHQPRRTLTHSLEPPAPSVRPRRSLRR